MKQIPLTQGLFTLVDDEDFDWLNEWKWRMDGGYAVHDTPHDENGKQIRIPMHRLIMELKKCDYAHVVDHIDHNGLNNQRYNLRICTRHQNQMNRKTTGGGIIWVPRLNKWKVELKHNWKINYYGTYKNYEDAVIVRNEKAKELRGEFAYLIPTGSVYAAL